MKFDTMACWYGCEHLPEQVNSETKFTTVILFSIHCAYKWIETKAKYCLETVVKAGKMKDAFIKLHTRIMQM